MDNIRKVFELSKLAFRISSYGLKRFERFDSSEKLKMNVHVYLTIIPRARISSESIAHEAEGRMGY